MDKTPLLVMTTAPDDACAEQMASRLVKVGLAGCVNILPTMRSIYMWQGAMVTGSEQLILIKGCSSRYAEIEKAIMALHPYELPEIIAVSIDAGLPAYLNWVVGQMPGESQ